MVVTAFVAGSVGLLIEAFAGISVRIHSEEKGGARPSPGASPSPSPSVAPAASPSPSSALDKSEAAQIRRVFARAASDELKALKHRQKTEFSELKASQKSRLREWDSRERETRRQFFAENRKGPERRAYVQDFIARRKALLSLFADERAARVREQAARMAAAQDEVSAKTRELEALLGRSERPPAGFWPRFQ